MKTATSVLLSALAMFCAAILTGCSSEPTYSRAKGDSTIVCHIKGGDEITPVTIVFRIKAGKRSSTGRGERRS